MKILFCKVSWMKFYQGASETDEPINGGRYVAENGFGYEEFNFLPITIEHEENDSGIIEPGEYYFGFVETMSTNKNNANQLHIENIHGCKSLKNESSVDDVLVVWFATSDLNETYVVGWYRNATVFRYYQPYTLDFEDGTSEERGYNVIAKVENCTLLPYDERRLHNKWKVLSKKYTRSFGYGQSMLWYAAEGNIPEQQYLKRLIENINQYDRNQSS